MRTLPVEVRHRDSMGEEMVFNKTEDRDLPAQALPGLLAGGRCSCQGGGQRGGPEEGPREPGHRQLLKNVVSVYNAVQEFPEHPHVNAIQLWFISHTFTTSGIRHFFPRRSRSTSCSQPSSGLRHPWSTVAPLSLHLQGFWEFVVYREKHRDRERERERERERDITCK